VPNILTVEKLREKVLTLLQNLGKLWFFLGVNATRYSMSDKTTPVDAGGFDDGCTLPKKETC